MLGRRKRRTPRFNLAASSPSLERDAAFVELLDHLSEDLAREHVRLVKSFDPSDSDSDSRTVED